MGYIYITITIIGTVYGQLVIKWRMSLKGQIPDASSLLEKIQFMLNAFMDVWIISGLGAAFLASFAWAAAMTKFDLSFAYPFTALSLVLVFILGITVFNEPVTLGKVIGMSLIVLGVLILAIKV